MTGAHKRKVPALRRLEILDAAITIAAERGLDAVNVRDVAMRVGVAPGLIHHYFHSVDELLAESFGLWADSVLEELQQRSAGVSPRLALALTVAHLAPEQRIWTDALGTAARFAQLRGRAKRLSEQYLAHVEGVIVDGVAQKQFSCADPRSSAWRIILVLDGAIPMMHIVNLIEPAELTALVGTLVERELGLTDGAFTELVQATVGATRRVEQPSDRHTTDA